MVDSHKVVIDSPKELSLHRLEWDRESNKLPEKVKVLRTPLQDLLVAANLDEIALSIFRILVLLYNSLICNTSAHIFGRGRLYDLEVKVTDFQTSVFVSCLKVHSRGYIFGS